MQLKQNEEGDSRNIVDYQHMNPQRKKQHQNYQYYQEYKRLYQTAFYLSLQLKQVGKTREEMIAKLAKYQKKTEEFKDDIRGEPVQRKKRLRRPAQEIQRKFICEVERCQRCYGSQGSLQQHIKLKHPQLYQAKSESRHKNQQGQQISLH